MRTDASVASDQVKAAADGRWNDILRSLAPEVVPALDGRGQHVHCPLPDHDDKNPSFRFDAKNGCFHCTCGHHDGFAILQKMRGWTFPEATREVAALIGNGGSGGGSKAAVDPLQDMAARKACGVDGLKRYGATVQRGEVHVPMIGHDGEISGCQRFGPKDNYKGRTCKGHKNGMFLPGRTPEAGETWLVCEGTKDAAKLSQLGYLVAGHPGDTLPAKTRTHELFAGCDVILVPDLDDASTTGAAKSAARLHGLAANVRVARLPGEHGSKDGAREALQKHDESVVRDAIDTATEWTCGGGARPDVLVSIADGYGKIADAVLSHLGRLGWDTLWIPENRREAEKLYCRGGTLVHVVDDDAGRPQIRVVPRGLIPIRISDACELFREDDEKERTIVAPPKWLVDAIHDRGDYSPHVRPLDGIVGTPTMRPDGSILQTPGYDHATRLIYRPSCDYPDVPEAPTKSAAKQAAAKLLEVVCDFPFADDADRSAWLAMVLTLIGRPAITGSIPLFAKTATCPGSGKTLQADAASLIAYGVPIARKSYTSDDNEMRKVITAIALEARPAVLLDNVAETLGGPSLDACLTGETWNDRILTTNKTTGDIRMRAVWMAGGNNLQFGSDIARRVLPIRLEPQQENPEDRDDFRHGDLLGWTRDNRAELATAALTVLRAYFVAGRPEQPGGRWGSFESWSSLVRGAIVWLGLSDPLATRVTAREQDRSGDALRMVIAGLRELDPDGEGMTAKEICEAIQADTEKRFPIMAEMLAEVATVRGALDSRRLGYHLRKHKGRVAGGFKLVTAGTAGKVKKWSIQAQNDGPSPPSPHHHPTHHPTVLPQENREKQTDRGDGGDTSKSTRVRGSDISCTKHENIKGREVSPPSPPSPPAGDWGEL